MCDNDYNQKVAVNRRRLPILFEVICMEKYLKIIKIAIFVMAILLLVFSHFFDDIFGPITDKKLISDFQKMEIGDNYKNFEYKTGTDEKITIWFSDTQNEAVLTEAFPGKNLMHIYAVVEIYPENTFSEKVKVEKIVHLKTKEVPTNTLVLRLTKNNIKITMIDNSASLRSEMPMKLMKRIIECLSK